MNIESDRIGWQRHRRARVLGRVGMALFALVTVWDGLIVTFGPALLGRSLEGATYVAMLGLFFTSLLVSFTQSFVPGAVAIGAETLQIGRESIARARVASAYVVSRYVRARIPLQAPRRAPTIELVLDDGDVVSFDAPTFEAARAAVAELGFGRGGKRVTIDLGSPARRLYHLLMAVGAYYLGTIVMAPVRFLGLPPLLSSALFVAVLYGLYFGMKALGRAPSLTVGSDGVLWRWGVRKRLLRASTIRSVEQASIALPLLLHTSERMIPVVIDGKALDIERRGAAATLLHDRFVGPVSPAADPNAAAVFARRDRPLAEWRKDLASHAREAGYRQAAGRENAASAVLQSARASNDERVGAALALRVAGAPPSRIRIAAEAAADPSLRDALEAVAEEQDDQALDRALRRLRR